MIERIDESALAPSQREWCRLANLLPSPESEVDHLAQIRLMGGLDNGRMGNGAA